MGDETSGGEAYLYLIAGGLERTKIAVASYASSIDPLPSSMSSFRQITTSLGRLLAFIRLLLDLPARAALLRALLRSVGETGSAMAGLTSVELT